MTAPTSKFTAKYLVLLTLVTALGAEMIRFSGPLLDSAITRNGVIVAAGIALLTYLAPGLFVYALSARRRVSGPMVVIAVIALGVARLVCQFLDGMFRFGFGLATVALALATLGLVAAAASQEGPKTVAGGIGFGLLFSAGLNLALSTWDPLWRSGALPVVVAVFLGLAAVLVGLKTKGSQPQPHARGLWALGPVLSIGVVMFANPAFISSQSHLPLWLSGLVISATALALPTVLDKAHAHRFIHAVIAVLAVASIFFVASWPATPSLLVSIALMILLALLGLSVIALLAVIVSRPADQESSAQLSLAISAAGGLTILPILLFQLDYDIPLGFPNAFIFVAAAVILAGAGLVVGGRTSSVDLETTRAHFARIITLVGIFAVIGMFQTSGLTSAAPAAPVAQDFAKVFNWNLHYGVNSHGSVDLNDVVELIRTEQATVVTLQEVSRGWIMGGGADMVTYLANELGMEFAFVGAADHQFGNALLWHPDSPVTDIERIKLTYGDGPQWRSAISGTVNLDGGQFRVITAHLQHRDSNTPTRISQLDDLFVGLPAAGSTLITGDFNAEPGWEEIEYLFGHGFISAQDTAGDSSHFTFPSDNPNVRIDWLFGKDLTFSDFQILPSVTSDHRPLTATVHLN